MVSVWVIVLLVLHSLYCFYVVPNLYDLNNLWILRKKHFGALLTILTMWSEFLIHFPCSFKFVSTILSFYCGFVHSCSICSSYIRFVFGFDVYFLRFSLRFSCLFKIFVDLLEFCHRCLHFPRLDLNATDSYSLVLMRVLYDVRIYNFLALAIFPPFYFHNYISYGVFECVV